MISPLLRRELRVRLVLDPIPEDGRLALELARGVAGLDPVGDGGRFVHCARGEGEVRGGGDGAVGAKLGEGGYGSERESVR